MPDKELVLSCDCVGRCSALMAGTFYDMGEDTELFLEIATGYTSPNSLKERIIYAWKVLRGKNDVWFHAICFQDVNKVKQLRDFLDESLKEDANRKENNHSSSKPDGKPV